MYCAFGASFINFLFTGSGADAEMANPFIVQDFCKILKLFFGTEEKLISAIHSFVMRKYSKGNNSIFKNHLKL